MRFYYFVSYDAYFKIIFLKNHIIYILYNVAPASGTIGHFKLNVYIYFTLPLLIMV